MGMRQTSRSTVDFSTAELRLLLRTLHLFYRVDQAIGQGPDDGMDALMGTLALEALLKRRGIEPLPLPEKNSRVFRPC